LPVTVGVFGDWGSGKSTVMNLAREALDREDDILCVHFNGWLFEGYEDAKAAILGTILDKLDERLRAGRGGEEPDRRAREARSAWRDTRARRRFYVYDRSASGSSKTPFR
jgi:hypothetical protein